MARINNYQGVVGDEPMNTRVVQQEAPHAADRQKEASFLDRILRQVNSQNTVPIAELPVYEKGNSYAVQTPQSSPR